MTTLERTPAQRLQMAAGAGTLRLLVATLGRTLRLEVECETTATPPRPALLVFWHSQAFLAAVYVRRRLVPRNEPLVLLSSPSFDGDLSVRLARAWGIEAVRASASRRGARGLRELSHWIQEADASPIITPDGPRGPAETFNPAALQAARLTGIPVQPIGFATDRFWRLNSWDRMIVPRPRAGLSVVMGRTHSIPRQADAVEMTAIAGHLGAELNRLTAQARTAEPSATAGHPRGIGSDT